MTTLDDLLHDAAAQLSTPAMPPLSFERLRRRRARRAGLQAAAALLAVVAVAAVVVNAHRSADGVSVATRSQTTQPRGHATTVPDVRGMTGSSAIATLTRVHLRVAVSHAHSDVVPIGAMIEQQPPAGTTVATDWVVQLVESSGPGPLSSYLEAPVTIRTGTSTHATLVITNNTHRPVQIALASGRYDCRADLAAVLTNATVPPDPIWVQVCISGGKPLTVPVGRLRLNLTITAAYSHCGQRPEGRVPACSAGGPAPLPPGDYQLVLVESAPIPALPIPSPLAVHLLPSP